MKLNKNGAWKSDTHAASASGVVRDRNRSWLWEFTRNLGCCLLLEAELWPILDGLNLHWMQGFRCVEIESESAGAVCIISDESAAKHSISLAAESTGCTEEHSLQVQYRDCWR
ncbi:hypothetical protein CXB51_009810 [Gossypium anomalum]|uniref:RNase H type-1 domain-containing protein n=1 Tax=Gossypium anomalum TaxID=47600 RepID=A0A8J5YLX8_9ROSI|nr:hypothetical protein CXB51_009810 [Gossypium anomalum]